MADTCYTTMKQNIIEVSTTILDSIKIFKNYNKYVSILYSIILYIFIISCWILANQNVKYNFQGNKCD